MPCLTLSTNVDLDPNQTSSVLSQLTSTVANVMSRPHSYVTVALEASMHISFGGTEEPAAYGELVAIGALNPDMNNKLSAAIASVLETTLSVPKSRFFLSFNDIELFWQYFWIDNHSSSHKIALHLGGVVGMLCLLQVVHVV